METLLCHVFTFTLSRIPILVACVLSLCGCAFAQITTYNFTSDAIFNALIDYQAFVPEGRIGNNSLTGDFELDIHINPGTPEVTAQYVWPNNQTATFTVTYNAGTGLVTFTVNSVNGTTSISHTYPILPLTDIFIRTRAVNANTSIVLTNLQLNAIPIAGSSSASNPGTGTDYLWIRGASLNAGFTLTGTSKMAWNVLPSQSRLAYQIKIGKAKQPCLQVSKAVFPTSASPGEQVSYKFVVSNCGQIAIKNIVVVDDNLGNITPYFVAANGGSNSLAAGAQAAFSVPYTVKGSDPDPLVNKVTAKGVDDFERDVTAEDTATLNISEPATVCICGAAYDDILCNGIFDPTDPPLHNTTFTLTDPLGNPVYDINGNLVQPQPGPFFNFVHIKPAKYLIVKTDPPDYVSTNAIPGAGGVKIDDDTILVFATIAGFSFGPNIFLDYTPHACIEIDKTVDPIYANTGDVVTYTYVVRNCGNQLLSNVTVNDDVLGDLTADFIAANGGSNQLPVGVSVEFNKPYTSLATDPPILTNNVTATAKDPEGATVDDSDTADLYNSLRSAADLGTTSTAAAR